MPKLLRRTSLLPGESLQSLLTRLAWLNFYSSPVVIEKLCVDNPRWYGASGKLCLPTQNETFVRMADLTGIDASELYAASGHRFALVLTLPGDDIQWIKMSGGQRMPLIPRTRANFDLRSLRLSQFCPDCLKELAYHRSAWSLIAVSVCLRHKRLLTDKCQHGHPIHLQDVLQARCPRCKADLRETQTASVADDGFGLFAHRIIQSWLGISPPPRKSSCPYTLPKQSPSALFGLLDGLRSSIMSRPNWRYAHQVEAILPLSLTRGNLNHRGLSSAQSYLLYATAFRGIINWPEGFFDFLRAYTSYSLETRRSGTAGLGSLYVAWLERGWKHEAFGFIQAAFHEYLLKMQPYLGASVIRLGRCRRSSELAYKFDYITMAEASRLLRVSPETIKHLVRSGQLSTGKEEKEEWTDLLWSWNQPTERKMVNRNQVAELLRSWSGTLTLEEAARWLGVSEPVVIDLVKLDCLKATRGPLADGSYEWRFARSAVNDLIERIAAYTTEGYKPTGPKVSLAAAARRLAAIEVNAARILKYVADRELKGYYSEKESSGLKGLWFAEADICALGRTAKVKRGWVGRKELAQRMGVKVIVVARWVRAGLLQPTTIRNHAQYFSQNDVDQFQAEHIFAETAADILGVGRLVVQKWARSGRLKAVSGPTIDGNHRWLFRREEVERLRPDNRLTAPQLAQRLSLSRSQMSSWIRQGKVKPVSGPGIDRSKHYLFDAQGFAQLQSYPTVTHIGDSCGPRG